MTLRGLSALGIGQCVNWGVLYYAFAVLVQPLERELAVPTWMVTGAFSVALLTSAALAPAVGRWADRGRGPLVMQIGACAAAGLLALWTFMPGVFMLYAVWAALGLCMAMTLYEPAFVIIARAHQHRDRRLRALATLTLFGGLASTVFLPLTAWLVDMLAWRGTVLILAVLLVAFTAVTRTLTFRHLASSASDTMPCSTNAQAEETRHGRRFFVISLLFASTSLASAAFMANLVPALGEQGLSPAAAAMLGGLMGVMQLPGRALMMSGALAASPARLLAACLALHALGLACVAVGPSTALVIAGAMILALGAGLTTLVRPHLVHTAFSPAQSGLLNGRIARHQQLARAAGPLGVAWAASFVGYTAVLTALAVAFAIMAVVPAAFTQGEDVGSVQEAA
jgi:MFS family permease